MDKQHPTEPLLEALLTNQDSHAKDHSQLMEHMIVQADKNNPADLLEAQLIKTDEIVQTLKSKPEVQKIKIVTDESELADNFFRMLRGQKGEVGDKGDSIQGEKGDKGDKGEKGNKGEQGIVGPKGDSIKGDTGKDGKNGKDGLDGRDGTDGEKGEKGDKGKDGKSLSQTDIDRIGKKLKDNESNLLWVNNGAVKEIRAGTGILITGDPQTPTITSTGGYTLPNASSSVLGGVKIGARLTMTGDTLSADIQAGGSGTVTSVTSANTDATVATTTTTPVITIVSAPKLTTARTIGGTSFDGTANIAVALATTVTTNANLTGPVTSIGNATAIADAALSIAKTSGLQAALDLKAPLASPTFTGTVTVPTPSNATDAVTKAYADAITQSLDIKQSVRVASTANIAVASALINGSTIDGIVVATGERVLLKNQTTGAENGIYLVVASGAASRSTDADVSADVTSGMYVFVSEGTVSADMGYVLTTNDPITLGTTALVFTQFSGAGQITAGAGLTKTGNTLDAVGTANRVVISANAIDIGTDVVTLTETQTLTGKSISGGQITSAVANATLAANVTTNANLTGDATSVGNASTVVKINGTSLAGLATGILKNTTTTGVPSIAVLRTDYAEPTTALATGILKNTTTTGAHTIAINSDLPAMSATVGGAVPTPPNNTNTFLRGDGTFATPAGGGDMTLASAQTNSGLKTFLTGTFGLRNVANTFTALFSNTITAARTYTLKDADGTIAFTSDITGTNSGTNTGDNSANTLYSGLVTNATHTGDATGATALTLATVNSNVGSFTNASVTVNGKGLVTAASSGATPEVVSNKDATGGYAGLTLFKINFKNAANTITSFFTNANTAARTYTFPDKDITVAGLVDITGTNSGTNTGDQTTVSGNAGTATTLQTARTINGVSFNGSANITVPSDITPSTSGNVLTSNGTVWTSAVPASGGTTNNVTMTARLATASALPANTYLLGVLTGVSLGALTVDGVATVLNDFLLVKDEATGANNGLYKVTTEGTAAVAYILTRSTQMDVTGEFVGAVVPIASEGTANKNTQWRNTNATAPTVGTTAVTFAIQALGTSSITSAQLLSALTDETGTGANVFATSPTLVTPAITGLATGTGVATANTVSTLVARDASGNFAAGTITAALTGTASGNLVSGGALGTPSSGVLTNATGLPAASVVAGILGVTGTRMTKLWATDIESTNAPTVGGVVVPTISSTNTLTNKRINPRLVTAASYTTDTGTSLDVSTCDQFEITAQAGALLFNAPGGTPLGGQKLVVRIKDNATARALTWNAIFRAMGTALPSTTVLSKTLYLGFFYNATDTKWDLVASAQEA